MPRIQRLGVVSPRLLVALAVFAVGMPAAESATRLAASWKAPDAKPLDGTGKKVAGVFMSRHEDRRRKVEDALARELTQRGAQGVAAYTLFSTEDLKDRKRAKEALAKAGLDGVVVLRVVGSQWKADYRPGDYAHAPVYYQTLGGYWDWGWSSVYEPDYLSSDTQLTVETLLFSLSQDRLVWGGLSETTDPKGADRAVRDIVRVVADELRAQGLIRAQPSR